MDRRHGDWASQEYLIRRAQGLEPLLHAYVAFAEPVETPRGFLHGLPYAAKDIFAAPDRVPCGGLSAPLPPMDVPHMPTFCGNSTTPARCASVTPR